MVAAVLVLVSLVAAVSPSAAEGPAVSNRLDLSYVDSVDVNQVNVEVLVTNRRGHRVVDLTREDFEILEDGKRVEISHFRPPEVLTRQIREVAEAIGVESRGESPPPAALEEPPLHLLLFVDTLSLRPRHRRQLFEALRDSLSREKESLRLMLVTFDGRLLVRHGFDSPTSQVLATLTALEGGRWDPRDGSRRGAAELAAAAAELEAAQNGSPELLEAARSRRDSALAELQPYAESERQETLRKLDVLRQLAFSLGGIAGRKSILYAGDDLMMAPAAELYAAADNAFGGQGSPGGGPPAGSRRLDLYRDFKGLVRQANASGVSFYTLTPPSRQHLGDVGLGRLAPPGFESSIHSERQARIKEASCLMAHTTGGRCQSGGSDFSLLIDGALEDLEAVYSLGYVPDRPPDGAFHRIAVRVKRTGLKTRHRNGYVDRTANDRLRERLSASLWFGADEDRLGVELVFEEQRSLGKGRDFVVPVRVMVPLESFAMLPSADPRFLAAEGRVLVLAAAENGRLTHNEEIPISLRIDAAKLAAGTESGYGHLLELYLERGLQTVAIGVWDEVGRQGSFLGRSIVVGASDGD